MKISIITATYNSAAHIADCLASVNSQTHKNIEHIIVDGASTDNTLEIIKTTENRVAQLISEPDHGIYDALNKGIRLATGDIIGFLHADDTLASPTTIEAIAKEFNSSNQNISTKSTKRKEFSPQTIKNTASSLLSGEMSGVKHAGGRTERSTGEMSGISGQRGEAPHQIDGIYGNLVFTNAENKIVRTWQSKPFLSKNVRHGWMPPHPTLFLRKEVYEKHGLFDTSFKIAGDYDFMLRVMTDPEIQLRYLPEIITRMRVGGASTGSIKGILLKMQEDIRALRNNGFNYPLAILAAKNLRKLPQLLQR
jgi:glycosyltransferase